MKIEQISNRNYLLKQRLSEWDLNLHFIAGTVNNYVIDTGLGSESVAPIKDFLKHSNLPTVVVNTHYHWDHVWGNHCFSDSAIISHRLCRPLIEKNWNASLAKNRSYMQGDVRCLLPNLLFDEELYFPDDGIRLFYSPGHTDDSISVYDEKDRILDAGDNIGDTVEEIVPSIEGEQQAYIETIRKYQSLGAKACVSGHNIVLGADVFQTILEIAGR